MAAFCIIIGILIVLAVALYVYAVMPKLRWRERMLPFKAAYIAHRGLYDAEGHIPENSIAAFRQAVSAGYGIELDARLSKDDTAVVFHDKSLLRMCGVDKNVSECGYDELKTLSLSNEWGAWIPTLQEALSAVNGQVPLLVEIKADGGNAVRTARKIAEILDDYKGDYCIMSFDPAVVAWFRRNRPKVFRGQLSTNWKKEGMGRGWYAFTRTNLLHNYKTRPNFVMYDYQYKTHWSPLLCWALFPYEKGVWTIKTPHELVWADHFFDMVEIEKGALGENKGDFVSRHFLN